MGFFPEVSIFSRTSEEWLQLLYDDREMCKKPAPAAFRVSLTTAQLVAAPIYIVAFYTLYSVKSQNFKVYKKYLATHAVSNFVFELHVSIMKPVLYLPYPVVRFSGTFVLRYINGGITLFIFLLFILFTCWSILELFHYRHILITDNNLCSTWVKKYSRLATIVRKITMIFTFCTIGLLAFACAVGLFDQNEHKLKLSIITIYPEILCKSAIVLPRPSDSGIKPIHLFNLSALILIVFGTTLCISQGVVSMMSLQEMVQQTRTSLRTIAIHKAFLISLFCQITVHCIMLGFPIVIYITSLFFNFNVNAVGYMAITVASMHGAASTLAMILFNRPLYEKASAVVMRLFSSNNVVIQDISFISMINSRG